MRESVAWRSDELAHGLTPTQLKVMRAIEACRTEKLGGHLYVCDQCHHEVGANNSCRNRHCPTCQSLNQARWIEKRKERVLDVGHFHVVFTLPEQLRPLAFQSGSVFNLASQWCS